MASDDATPTRRSSIWMPYGDIILQAEDTQFRVNRDILARQSAVFQDMFSVPQPPVNNEPSLEGCPIVQVSDSAKDWEMLLKLFYDPFDSWEPLPFELVVVMLGLGRKYEMSTVQNNVLARIHYEYPNELNSWVNLGTDLTKLRVAEGVEVELLNLVCESGIKTSIPTLGYHCLNNHSLDSLLNDRILRPDGTPIILSASTKFMLAIAVERFFVHLKSMFTWLDEDEIVIPTAACKSRAECSERRRALYRCTVMGEGKLRYTSLDSWRTSDWSDGLCRVCDKAGQTKFEECRAQTWEALPGLFGLPEWKELKDDEL